MITPKNFNAQLASWIASTKKANILLQALIMAGLELFVSTGSAGKLDAVVAAVTNNSTKATAARVKSYILAHSNLKYGNVGKMNVDGTYAQGFSKAKKGAASMETPAVAWIEWERPVAIAKPMDAMVRLDSMISALEDCKQGFTDPERARLMIKALKLVKTTMQKPAACQPDLNKAKAVKKTRVKKMVKLTKAAKDKQAQVVDLPVTAAA